MKASINPDIIKWARESANLTYADLASGVSVAEDKIKSWEAGESQPTFRQAKLLAKKCRRALSLFYLPEPPSDDFKPIKDFRRGGAEFSTGLVFLIRELQEKSDWMSSFLQSDSEPPLQFVGKYNINSNIEEIASEIRSVLKIDDRSSSDNPLNYVIEKIESLGIFVCRSGAYHSHLPIEVDEARGFALCSTYAPFIFLNSRDSREANLFTLIHELAHIWINESGVSNQSNLEFRSDNTNYSSEEEKIEVFCNKVAANVLMPEDLMRRRFSNYVIGEPEYERRRRSLGMSKIAMAYRVLNLGIVSMPSFNRWKIQYDASINNTSSKRSSGGGDFYRTRAVRNSKSFSAIVINLYSVGAIQGGITSNLLGLKLNQLNTYKSYLP